MPAKNLSQGDPEDAEFETGLVEVENSLAALQERCVQIRRDRQHYIQLQQQLKQAQAQTNPPLKTELRQIQQQLEEVELNLESRLLKWSSFKEPFWQVVRFGGMGVIVGWILKSCAS